MPCSTAGRGEHTHTQRKEGREDACGADNQGRGALCPGPGREFGPWAVGGL